MASCHDIQPLLSAYVDGDLTDAERARVIEHLGQCAACQSVVSDLDRLTTAARQLGPMPPPDHLWLEVAGQVRLAEKRGAAQPAPMMAGRRATWQWIGLAAALVVLTLGAYTVSRWQRAAAPAPAAGNAAASASVEGVEDELKQAEQHYEKAISQLEAITKADDVPMDPVVAATLQRNLAVIDQAITESRTALSSDPQSEPARDSLFEALRHKVSVLQATVELMNEMRKGNQEGAAKVAAGISKKS